MKRIIIVLMMLVSMVSFSNDVTIEQYLQIKNFLVGTETLEKIKSNAVKVYELYIEKGYIESDLLTSTIKTTRKIWDKLDKNEKEIFLLSLLVAIEEKTDECSVMVQVDYTTVLWVIDETIYTHKVY